MPIRFPDIPERIRAYFYRLVAAALPVIAVLDDGFDLTDPADAAAVLGFLAAILATANTSRNPDDAGQSVLVVALIAAAVCFLLLLALDVIHIR